MAITRGTLVVLLIWASAQLYGQTRMVSTETVTALATSKHDTVYVINFWATWCKPCIKEMPYFQALADHYKDQAFSLIFVSVNRPKELSMVDQFLEKQALSARTWLLNEKDPNVFIPAIAEEWSGAIPATLVYHPASGYRAFYEREFTLSSLHDIIDPLME